MVWPTLGSRTAKEQNRTEQFFQKHLSITLAVDLNHRDVIGVLVRVCVCVCVCPPRITTSPTRLTVDEQVGEQQQQQIAIQWTRHGNRLSTAPSSASDPDTINIHECTYDNSQTIVIK